MRRPIEVAIVATPEVEPWVALGIHDALWAVGVLWNRIMGEPEEPAFAPKIVATDQAPLETGTGVFIQPHTCIADAGQADIIFVPSLLIPCGADFAANNPAMLAWVRDQYEGGARVVSSCTGSFLLAEAGMLNACEATTHWAFVDLMRSEYPKVKVRADRIIVAADPDARIVTAGGATSWTDLVLYLVGRFATEEDARRLAKMSLFDWHHNGQNPYARLTTRPQSDDAVVRKVQEWLADHYAQADIVTAMTKQSGLNSKTFARRFKAATGFAPLDYVQRLRIEESKQLLESGRAGVDAIGEAVGYQDAVSFRRLFKRMVGESPAAYRKRRATPGFVLKLPQD